MMTLHEIKAMFAPGSIWDATNSAFPLRNGLREVVRVKTGEIEFRLLDGESVGQPYYTPLPKARELTEAKPGVLAWTFSAPLVNRPISVRLVKMR